MGFWGTLGKIGLNIAPYVAAPFTGGASLAFAPMANRLAQGIGPSNTMIDRIGGMAGQFAGAYGGGQLAGRMGGGGGGMMGNDLPSQGGIGGNLGNRNGLPPWVMNMAGSATSPRGQSGPSQGAMNSPYADPNDAMRTPGSGVLQNQGRSGGGFGGFVGNLARNYMQSQQGNPHGQNPSGGGFGQFIQGMFGGGQGTQGVMGGFQNGGDVYSNPQNASQMGQNQGLQPGGHMGLGPRFDANSPDLAMAIEAGRRQQQRVMYQPQQLPMMPSPATMRSQGGVM